MLATMPVTFRVRELREASGLSLEALAAKAKLRPATLSALETGKTTRVDLQTLDRISLVLNVEPGFLLVRVPDATAKPAKGKGARPPVKPTRATGKPAAKRPRGGTAVRGRP